MENSPNKDLINKHSDHFDSNQCVLWSTWNLGLVQAGDLNGIQSDHMPTVHVCAVLLINKILKEVVFAVRSNPCHPRKKMLILWHKGFYYSP